MESQFIILGCGSSVGVPRIDGYWGKCNKNIKKNIRTRCSAIIKKGNNLVLIDTSPDLRQQLLSNEIKNLSYVIYTHAHADQIHGINELRPIFWKNNKKIQVYGNNKTIGYIKKKFNYCFKSQGGYKAFLKSKIVNKKFSLGKKNEKIDFQTFKVNHGQINSQGYVFEKIAYLSDCNGIPSGSNKNLYNLNYLILDCLKLKKHPTHFNLDQALKVVEKFEPKMTILTNLHSDLDYNFLLNNLPRNVKPAYDGLKINL